jgi:UDP-3-O-[3-hydroxymyristoyl] glucosamine N-acyltransferase
MKFSDIVEQLSAINGRSLAAHLADDPEIEGIAAIYEAQETQLSYIDGGKSTPQIHKTLASALILPQAEALHTIAQSRGIAWIAGSNPRLLFAQALTLFYQPSGPALDIHPTAVIHPTATLGKDVAIDAHVVIQANAVIGDRVSIHPNVVIYPEVQIGDGTVLHANCTIHERTQIGVDCVIQPGAVIGAEGFGFVPTPTGWYKMPQSGYVVLEEGVEVGCNSTIDRPAVGETRVGRQTKLDNLVHIGHGSKIGFGCAMAGQVGLAGGVKVGDRVIIAGQAGITNETTVGSGVTISSKAGVTSCVKDGETVSGFPHLPHKVFLKASVLFGRLPEMYQILKQLQKEQQR